MEPSQVDFTDDRIKNHDTPYLKELVRVLDDILQEHGRVSNWDILKEHDLQRKLDQKGVTWSKHHLRNNILPSVRNTLDDQGLIDVKEESAERGGFDRKLWVLPDGE